MSTYANSNYAPPPPMGQTNLVNGMPTPTMQQQQPQQQQLQQQQQQQQQQQFQQQHQQILQQKQQQFSAVPPPSAFNTNNMSKFLPPTATSTSSLSSAQPTPAAATNGPPRSTATAPPSTNLPPHLRPPGINGPASASTAGAASVPPPLTNGGNAGAALASAGSSFSANSSRTSSPALQTSPSHQFAATAQGMKFAPPTAALGAAATVGLTNSMQNLSMQTQQQQQQQQQTPSVSSNFSANFQSNFKTSAMQATVPQQQQSMQQAATTTPAAMPPTANMNRASAMGYSQPQQQLQQQQKPQQTQQQQLFPRPTTTAAATPAATQSSSIYGTTTAPPMMRPPFAPQTAPFNQATSLPPTSQQQQQQHINYAPTTNAMPPPTSQQNNAVFQQNQLNNNATQQQQTPQLQQSQLPPQMQQQQPRKPMYPSAAQLPPMPNTQQQQQQQPYSQAYHQQQQQPPQQPPPLPGAATFNGQTNAGPLQYQSMQQLPPQQQQQQSQQQYPNAPNYNSQMSVTQQGFSRLWGQDTVDLMQNRHILTPATIPTPKIVLHNQFHESINCNPNIMRCTIAKIPESNSLLQKSRLPLGILIHPFRDVNSLPVIQCPNIVRCRLCRTYINPFVYFVDSKMWKCNLCYRVNELPDDFQFDPATKTYGDVTRRPEVRSSTIEFIAPSEYMLRPPQPAIYLFLFDVSILAQQSGYLENVCAVLSKHLEDMPGDARTQVGFLAYNSQVHFYSMAEGYNQPHEMTLLDIDEPFLPRPDNLLVNLKECKELVKDLLTQLPKRFADTHDPGSALGAALQVAYKLMQASGGRVTVFQTCLPNKGPGALEPREDPNNRSAKEVAHLNPATDFYKRFALECSGYQIAVDLFLLNQQYSDLATISGISKHSGGCVHHFPLYQRTKPQHIDSVKQCFKRYLVRKIGFEAVMRIRCTRGLQVHTFHGNFFVRSTDLLSLPNVNPDAGYGMQISYEETLTDVKTICFQAALLYTNSEGERRIRVHTLCLPVTSSLSEVMHAADTEAIVGLLSKMAVDRSITSNIVDAREAFINATVDVLSAFRLAQNLPTGQTGQLIAPRSLALMPLYILALLKHPAFRVGTSTRLDDRVYAMDCMKTLPLDQLLKFLYPEFYHLDALFYATQNSNAPAPTDDDEEDDVPELPRLQLSAEHLDSRSMFLLDCGTTIIVYVGLNVPIPILESVLGIKATAELPDYYYGLPKVNSAANDLLKRFIMRLNDDKPYTPVVQIIRDTSTAKPQFIEKLVDDRSESSLSYYEFLQHIRTQVK